MAYCQYKFCIFGSQGVGKSSITVRFQQDFFPSYIDPALEDEYTKAFEYQKITYILEIIDTVHKEQFVVRDLLHMKTCQGIILVYSITDQSSINDLEKYYNETVRIKDTDCFPIVVVGNKSDLESQRVVYGNFIEVSSKYDTNIKDIFISLINQTNSH